MVRSSPYSETASVPEQETAFRNGTAALLATIGVAHGPNVLGEPEIVALAHCAAASGDAVIIDVLARAPASWAILDHPDMPEALTAALGGDPGLLSRAELIRKADDTTWRRAGGRLSSAVPPLRAVLGISVLVPLSSGSITVVEASRGAVPPFDGPNGGRQREIALDAGLSIWIALGSAYRLSHGPWLRIEFVRTWMKPDILFVQALSAELLRGHPAHVRDWCGAGLSLPVSVDEFLAAEEAAVRGTLANVHGRGV